MKIFSYLYKLLGKAEVYENLQNTLTPDNGFKSFIDEYVRPSKGCRIVDFGCGPAAILRVLVSYDADYVGVDYNPDYIGSARREFEAYLRARFVCASVDDELPVEKNAYDIALSVGVLHHLNDAEAEALIDAAWQALKLGGVFVTEDGAFVRGQNPIARLLLKLDRGSHVRSPEEYDRLISKYFKRTETVVVHTRLRIPYTHYITRCYKD